MIGKPAITYLIDLLTIEFHKNSPKQWNLSSTQPNSRDQPTKQSIDYLVQFQSTEPGKTRFRHSTVYPLFHRLSSRSTEFIVRQSLSIDWSAAKAHT